ncbi:hypothetical protein LTR08_003359 [Meristemomyces frigidus]|nr:hypothetical protein LTR08_003359 [Meristemomyces frigidus]
MPARPGFPPPPYEHPPPYLAIDEPPVPKRVHFPDAETSTCRVIRRPRFSLCRFARDVAGKVKGQKALAVVPGARCEPTGGEVYCARDSLEVVRERVEVVAAAAQEEGLRELIGVVKGLWAGKKGE